MARPNATAAMLLVLCAAAAGADTPAAPEAAPPAPADALTPAMRQANAAIHKIHTGMDRKTIDDAVAALWDDIRQFDSKAFFRLALPHLMRLAPQDTMTRRLLRSARDKGWIGRVEAHGLLVQAGDTPGPHIDALLEALNSDAIQTRSEAIDALSGCGPAAKKALPRLRAIANSADARPEDLHRAYTIRDEAPEHVRARWAIWQIDKDSADRDAKP